MRSFPEIETGSLWLMEEICSMGSVEQGRGARGAGQLLSWDVLRFNVRESQAWLDFSVDPALSRRLDSSPS